MRVTGFRLAPSEGQDYLVRMAVHGDIGGQLKIILRMKTNMPGREEAALTIFVDRISGGLEVSPQTVTFGEVVTGATVRREVSVIDRTIPPRMLSRARSDSEGVSVEVVPAPAVPWSGPGGGTLIGKVTLDVDSSWARQVGSRVDVWVDSTPPVWPVSFLVSGRASSPAEVSPKLVRLPVTSEGGPITTAVCVCRSPTSEPFSLRLVKAPPGWQVTLGSGNESRPVHTLKLSLSGHGLTQPKGGYVELSALTASGKVNLGVDVLVAEDLLE